MTDVVPWSLVEMMVGEVLITVAEDVG